MENPGVSFRVLFADMDNNATPAPLKYGPRKARRALCSIPVSPVPPRNRDTDRSDAGRGGGHVNAPGESEITPVARYRLQVK